MQIDSKLIEYGFKPLKGSFKPINKGGSMRTFFTFDDEQYGSCVACFYSAEKDENFLYAPIAEFLAKANVSVPKIYFHDAKEQTLIMSSAGDADLTSFTADADDLEDAYSDAVLNLASIHISATALFAKNPIKTMPYFDEGLYFWEQNYFLENCLKGRFNLEDSSIYTDFERITKKLLSTEMCLLHRDFQSQNVMVKRENGKLKTTLIDFQGLRFGVPWYDLGSFLYDPYVDLAEDFREKIFDFYYDSTVVNFDLGKDEALDLLYVASSERLLQALGAYGFLSQKKGKKEYENYILPALKNLALVSERAELKNIFKLASKCIKLI